MYHPSMRVRLARSILLLASAAAWAAPADVSAQGVDVGLNTAGLVSFQPVDSTYVGPSGPYLDRGLGGVGPGLSVGLDVVANRLALVFEYSTAWLSEVQQGRLVNGGRGPGRLHDSMVTGLAGAQLGHGGTRVQLLGGISHLAGTPTSNGVPRPTFEADLRRVAITGGIDIVAMRGRRASLLVTGRVYPRVQRSASAQQLGIGRDVFRAGAGVRWRLGSG
jgi:hypothetical protein